MKAISPTARTAATPNNFILTEGYNLYYAKCRKSISLENVTDVGAGLTSKEVSDRIAQGKVNGDFNIPSKSVKQIFKDNCLTFFNLINIILAAFVVAVGSFKNCLFLGVIICNTAIGIFQEIRSKEPSTSWLLFLRLKLMC